MKEVLICTLAICSGLLAIYAQAQSTPRFFYSADKQEVADSKTNLIWRRCVEGLRWNGQICGGSAGTYTRKSASAVAASEASKSGLAWRLPNIKELSTIADISRANPAIDSKAFPATPAGSVWSSSPEVDNPDFAWYVNFGDGYAHYDYDRGYAYHVRLVRSSK